MNIQPNYKAQILTIHLLFKTHLIIYPAFLRAQSRFPFLKSFQGSCTYGVTLIHGRDIFNCCYIDPKTFAVVPFNFLAFVVSHLIVNFVISYLHLTVVTYYIKCKYMFSVLTVLWHLGKSLLSMVSLLLLVHCQ